MSRNNDLEGQFCFRGDVAHESDCAALSDGVYGGEDGGVRPDALECGIGPCAAGDAANGFRDVGFLGVEGVGCTEFACEGEL